MVCLITHIESIKEVKVLATPFCIIPVHQSRGTGSIFWCGDCSDSFAV